MSQAKEDSYYRHYKDPMSLYQVLHLASYEAKESTKMVVYQDCKTGKVWVRIREDFESLAVDEDGETVERFMTADHMVIARHKLETQIANLQGDYGMDERTDYKLQKIEDELTQKIVVINQRLIKKYGHA